MSIIEKIAGVITGLIILAVIAYLGLTLFIAFAQAAFGLSLFTGIGFVVSVIITARAELPTPQALVLIFAGTVLSYLAGTLVPVFLDNLFAGQFMAAAVIFAFIVYLWLKAQEIKEGG